MLWQVTQNQLLFQCNKTVAIQAKTRYDRENMGERIEVHLHLESIISVSFIAVVGAVADGFERW